LREIKWDTDVYITLLDGDQLAIDLIYNIIYKFAAKCDIGYTATQSGERY